jgi:hypothetical protein
MEVTIKTEPRRDCPGVSLRVSKRACTDSYCARRALARLGKSAAIIQEGFARITLSLVSLAPTFPRATRASLFNDRTRAAQSSLRRLAKANAKKSSQVVKGRQRTNAQPTNVDPDRIAVIGRIGRAIGGVGD